MKNKQAVAPQTKPFGNEAFLNSAGTEIRWLGNAGVFINSRGTCVMVDPLLEGFDMPLLIDMPILPQDVPSLDAVLITHSDNDHFSVDTCKDMSGVCKEYHSTLYVSQLMRDMGLNGFGHEIGEHFMVGNSEIRVTPADHAWQNDVGGFERVFLREDFCGFYITTPDAKIWIPGDSRLMKEHLEMEAPDVMIFDFSDNSWHIGLENAIILANNYPEAQLILSHWGSVDAPDMDPFNADPASLEGKVVNPQRIHILAPGEAYRIPKD